MAEPDKCPTPALGRNELPVITAFPWRMPQLLSVLGVISPLVMIYAIAVLLGYFREQAYLRTLHVEYRLVPVDTVLLAFRSIDDLISAAVFVLQVAVIVYISQIFVVNRIKFIRMSERVYGFYHRFNFIVAAILGLVWSVVAILFHFSSYLTMFFSLMLTILIFAIYSGTTIPIGQEGFSLLHSNPYGIIVHVAIVQVTLALFLVVIQVRLHGISEAHAVIEPTSRGVILDLAANDTGLDGKKVGFVEAKGEFLLFASQTGDTNTTVIYWIPRSQIIEMESTNASCSEIPCG